jgi:3-dehydroquinate dehydratase / shikimate dehydrogenase
MICVSLGRTRHKMIVLEHRALAERGAELVELRLDWLSQLPDLRRLIDNRPTPVIITCRRRDDGGRWRGSEEQRLTILRSAIVAGVDYVDLEEDIAKSIPRYGATKRIVSYHNFDETPRDIEQIHARMCKLDPDIVKIVTLANSPGDAARMLQISKSSDVPTVAFGMGEIGLFSRILCGRFGSPLTYATFSRDRELAPGQLAFEEMRDIYRYESITEKTQIFGVIGDPVAHSMSPLVHNFAFQAAGIDAVYVPLRIPQDTLAKSLDELNGLGMQGFSVTIPHKQAAADYSHYSSESVRAIGAANTLIRNEMGEWQSDNTDYDAALDSVLLGIDREHPDVARLMGKKVMLLGAGGAARAVALAMVRSGAVVTIAGRTHKRAIALADEIGCQQCSWENRGAGEPDILINCTPVGLHPNVDHTPYDSHWLTEDMLVFDTVYNPETTLLLRNARQKGCKTVSGIEMFVRQAAEQFKMFTGQPASLEQMRMTVRRAISPLGDLP